MINKAKAAALIDAWHGPLTAGEIVRRYRLSSERMLQKFWQRQKEAGTLPRNRARPHFEVRTTLPDAVEIDFDGMSDAQIDRHIAHADRTQHERNEHSSASLLSALRGAHGDLDHPKFHHWKTAPASLGGLEAA